MYELYNRDCLEQMKEIPDRSIDMILCDLPYGMTRNKWDSIIPLKLLWQEYNRIIKDNGVIALFCDGLFMAELMLSNVNMWRYNLCWDKQKGSDFLNANIKPLKSHENIAIFYKNRPTYNKQYWYDKPYKKTLNGRPSTNWGDRGQHASESIDGKRCPLSVLQFPRESRTVHPTQKPVSLLEWLIKTYTNEGDTVLDNCMGSGSTIVAALNTGRNAIGIELDEKYFNIAKERIANVQITE